MSAVSVSKYFTAEALARELAAVFATAVAMVGPWLRGDVQRAVLCAAPTFAFAATLTALTARPGTSATRDCFDTALAYICACFVAGVVSYYRPQFVFHVPQRLGSPENANRRCVGVWKKFDPDLTMKLHF